MATDEDWDTLEELVNEIYDDNTWKSLEDLEQLCKEHEIFDDDQENVKKILKGVLGTYNGKVSKEAFTSFVFACGASEDSGDFPIQRNVMKYLWDEEKGEIYHWFHPDCNNEDDGRRLRERPKGSYLIRYCEVKKGKAQAAVFCLTRSSLSGDKKSRKIARHRIKNCFDGTFCNLETGAKLDSLLDVIDKSKVVENGGVPRPVKEVRDRQISDAYSPTPGVAKDAIDDAYGRRETVVQNESDESAYGVTENVNFESNYTSTRNQGLNQQSDSSISNYSTFSPNSAGTENQYSTFKPEPVESENQYSTFKPEPAGSENQYSTFKPEPAGSENQYSTGFTKKEEEPKENAYATIPR